MAILFHAFFLSAISASENRLAVRLCCVGSGVDLSPSGGETLRPAMAGLGLAGEIVRELGVKMTTESSLEVSLERSAGFGSAEGGLASALVGSGSASSVEVYLASAVSSGLLDPSLPTS